MASPGTFISAKIFSTCKTNPAGPETATWRAYGEIINNSGGVRDARNIVEVVSPSVVAIIVPPAYLAILYNQIALLNACRGRLLDWIV